MQEAGWPPISLALFRQLTRAWYDAIVDDLHLCRQTFQLAQGVMPIGNASDALWPIERFPGLA